MLVLSDLHLWQFTDHEDMWMRYRHRRFSPDAQLAELLGRVYAEIGDAELELILNGDIFDFDIPPVVAGHAVPAPSPRTAAEAVDRLAAILDDHELFLTTLAGVLARGGRVVLVAGNHDIQLSFPEVQTYLRQRLTRTLRRQFPCTALAPRRPLLLFRSWYYQTACGVHIEHGNQYDLYCSVPDPTAPFCPRNRLRPNAGSLVIEHLIGHLGYFNPNVDSSFLLTTREYLLHWQTYYKRSRRSLVGRWFFGSLRIIWELSRTYGFRGAGWPFRGQAAPRRDHQLPLYGELEHAALFALPDVRAAMKLLCIDQALGLLAALLALLLALMVPALGVPLLLALLGFLYSRRSNAAAGGPSGGFQEVSEQVAQSARAIARIHGARAVVFGHTHKAAGTWENGVFFGNCGTWAPLYHDVACTIAVESSRPLIWLRSQDSQLFGGLYRFHDGQIHQARDTQLDCSTHVPGRESGSYSLLVKVEPASHSRPQESLTQ